MRLHLDSLRGAAFKRLYHIERSSVGGSALGLQTSRHPSLINGLADSKLNVNPGALTRMDM
jgi:hypothetical protein